MNEEDRREIEVLRARIKGLQQELDGLMQRLVRLEQRVGSASIPSPRPAPSPAPTFTPPPIPTAPKPPPTPIVLSQPLHAAPTELPPIVTPTPLHRVAEKLQEARPSPLTAPPPPRPPPPVARPLEPEKPKMPLELWIGTYLLPRIGIVALIMMVGFAAWTWGPLLPKGLKAAGLYLVGAGLIGGGWWVERKNKDKEHLVLWARLLLAGGLAAVYFVTYAIHFVPALRLITEPSVDAGLLLVWAGVMVGVSQWKRSQPMAGLAFFLGYYSAILPQMPWANAASATPFTLVAVGILAAGIVFLFVRNGWTFLTYGGILATYGAYYLWFANNQNAFSLEGSFLALFWVLFASAVLLSKHQVLPHRERNVFGTVNNAAYYALMTWALAKNFPRTSGHYWMFPAAFALVLLAMALGLRKRFAPERTTFETFSIQALGLISVAIITKWSGYEQLVALAVQATVLLVLGWRLQWLAARVMAILAYGAGFVFEFILRAQPVAFFNPQPEVWTIGESKFLALTTACAAGLAMAWFDRRGQETAEEQRKTEPVLLSTQYFSTLAALFALWTAHRFVAAEIFPGVTALASAAILLVGLLSRNTEISLASQLPMIVGQISLLGLWATKSADALPPWSESVSLAYTFALALTMALVTSKSDMETPLTGGSLRARANLYYCWATVLLTMAILFRVDATWEFAALAVEALAILGVAIYARLGCSPWLNGALLCTATIDFLANYQQVSASLVGSEHVTKTMLGFVGVALFFANERVAVLGAPRLGVQSDAAKAQQFLTLALGNVLLLDLLWLRFQFEVLPGAMAIASAALLASGFALRAREWRVASQLPLFVGQLVLLSLWASRPKADLPLWSELLSLGYTFAIGLAMAWRVMRAPEPATIGGAPVSAWANVYYCWGAFLLTLAFFKRADHSWQFAALAGETLLILVIGTLARLKATPTLNVILLLVATADALVTYAPHGASLGAEGWTLKGAMGFLGTVAFFINDRAMVWATKRVALPDPMRNAMQAVAVSLGSALLVDMIWMRFASGAVTPLWSVAAFVLFVLGFLWKSRQYRWSGLALIGLSLVRVMVYDTAKLQTIERVISYGVIGVLLIVLGYLYARNYEKIKEWL